MRIAILVHSLSGGGAERVASLWATGFASRGDNVCIIIQTQTPGNTSYKPHENVDVFCIQHPFANNRVLSGLLSIIGFVHRYYLRILKQKLHDFAPDVCIGVMGSYANDAYVLTRDLNTCIIQTYHNSFELPETAPSIRKKDLRRRFFCDRNIKYKTVLTKADKDVIADRMNEVFVLPNPLAFKPLDCIPRKEKIVLACGRLDVWEVKGFDVLIKAWGKICYKHPDWILRIAGAGSDKSLSFLNALADECGIKNQIEFVGFREDISNLYKEAEIFVLSSRYEGFGMVLIEAMSQGCACVACDYKGRQREIIEDDTQGLICPPDDVSSLSSSIEIMITQDAYRKDCQKNSIRRSSFFSLENTIDRWETIFENVGIK